MTAKMFYGRASYLCTVLFTIAFQSYSQTTSPADTSLQGESLSELVVTGQYQPQSVKNSVYQIRVINQENIRMRNATDVLEVLNNELGVRFSTDLTLGETDIQLMGMSGQDVKILLDGVPLIDRGGTKQSLSQIDVNSVERIEIIEGPMSVMYGTDALAGVINIITKSGNGGTRPLSITAGIQEETVGKEYEAFRGKGVHSEHLLIGWNQKSWYAKLSGSRNNFGGWQGDKTGRVKDWLPKDQALGTGQIGFRNNRLHLWYRLNYMNEKILSPGKLNPNNQKAKDAEYNSIRQNHEMQAEWKSNNRWSFNGVVSHQDYSRDTKTTIFNAETGEKTVTSGQAEQDQSGFNTTFVRATAQYLPSRKISFQLGTEFERDNADGERIEGSPAINDYSLFVSSEIKPIERLNIRPGVRFSKNSIYKAPPVIPSLAAKFTLSKNWDIRLSYARGFRSPTLRELYFEFFDANHSMKGNKDLKAEYSNSFNGSLNLQWMDHSDFRLSSSLSGFYNLYNNRIGMAAGINPSRPDVFYYINIDKYRTMGGTWQNTWQRKNLQLSLGLSYIGRFNRRASDSVYTKDRPLPKFIWSPELSTNLIYDWAEKGVKAGVFYKYTGALPRYELDDDGSVRLAKTGSYHWLDIDVSKAVLKYLRINTGIKNILDIKRIKNTSVNTGGAHSSGGPVPVSYGRSFFLGLKFEY